MTYKTVSPLEFEKLKSESLLLGACPLCGSLGGKIEILMPCYGRSGVRVACINPKCDCMTELFGYTEGFFDTTNRIGSFTTKKSLMNGIKKAVEKWNGKKRSRQ